ncbi:MAG: HEAT repeat domain-containing protein [Planctomycetia bacterium]
MTASLWGLPSASGQVAENRAGEFGTRVPIATPPPRFGYHRTKWRSWEDDEPPASTNMKAATPAAPPRLEVPDLREESPRRADEPPPRAAAANAGGMAGGGLTLEQRAQRLARQAAAAKAGSREQQSQFTRALVAEILAAHDPELRCRIVATVADFDTPEANAILTGALQDPNDRVRMTACTVWGRRGGPSAVQLLSTRYDSDTDLGVRLRALAALAELDDDAAIPAIAKALDDADPVVRKRAMQSLKQRSGRDLGNDVDAWRAWAADPDRAAPRWSWLEAFRKLF